MNCKMPMVSLKNFLLRIKYWLGSGAKTSKSVEQLLGLCGFFPVHPMTYITAKRNRVKAEAKEKLADSVTPDDAQTS
jgi:small subunit ribosomal protein S16